MVSRAKCGAKRGAGAGPGGLRHGGAPFTAMNWDFKQPGGCFSPSPRAQTGQGHGERVKMAQGARLMGVRAALPRAGPAGTLPPSLCSLLVGVGALRAGSLPLCIRPLQPRRGSHRQSRCSRHPGHQPPASGGPLAPQHPTAPLGIPATGSVGDEDIRARWVKAREPSPLCTHSVISVNYAQT